MLQALGAEPHAGCAGAVEGAGFVGGEIGRGENGGVALARWAQTTEAQIQVSGVRLTDTILSSVSLRNRNDAGGFTLQIGMLHRIHPWMRSFGQGLLLGLLSRGRASETAVELARLPMEPSASGQPHRIERVRRVGR